MFLHELFLLLIDRICFQPFRQIHILLYAVMLVFSAISPPIIIFVLHII
nr:MAG TPA: hypothetical protein [Caudoviricetes sp.]